MVCAPGANTGLIEAAPPLTATVPRFVVPSVKVTVPVICPDPFVSVIVAVRRTARPAIPGSGVAVTTVVVCAGLTTWTTGADVEGALYGLPSKYAVHV